MKKIYNALFLFIARERIRKADLDLRRIHLHLAFVLLTAIIMWSYTLLSYYEMSARSCFYAGVLSSTLHLLSPLSFRFTRNMMVATAFIFLPGTVHTVVFTACAGGLSSFAPVWFATVLLLAGLIDGSRKTVIFWGILFTVIVITFILQPEFLPVADRLSVRGHYINNILILFGMMFFAGLIAVFLARMNSGFERILQEQHARTDSLVRVVIHDISNKLNYLSFSAEELSLAENSDNRRFLNLIRRGSTEINDIVETIRHLIKAEDGKKQIIKTGVSGRELAAGLRKAFEQRMAEKNLTLRIVHRPEEVIIRTDAHILRYQVLENILSNAIKFSEIGSEILLVFSQNSASGEVVISVKDYGVGMPPQILENLFKVNSPTHRRGTADEPGTGYGMVIMKSFVSLLDGRVEVDSNENGPERGSEFRVYLPA